MTTIAPIQARIAEIQGLMASMVQRGATVQSPAAQAPAQGAFAQALTSAQAPGTTAGGQAPTATATATDATTATTRSAGAFGAEITAAATRNGVDPALLTALVKQESGFDPNARSGAGAVGLTQLMPATAAAMGVSDPTDPAQSLQGGAKYLREQLDRFGGDPAKALAAYNAGPGAVMRYGGVPPYAETQHYVQAILADARGGQVN